MFERLYTRIGNREVIEVTDINGVFCNVSSHDLNTLNCACGVFYSDSVTEVELMVS